MDRQTQDDSIYHTSIALHGKSDRKCVRHVRDNVSIIQETATAWQKHYKTRMNNTYSSGYGGDGKSTDMHSNAANVTAAI